MFRRIGDSFRNFMLGRYGSDRLGTVLVGCGIVLMLLSSLLGGRYLWASWLTPIAYVPFGFCIFRMYSRNLTARKRENDKFLAFFRRLKDREHRYYRCPRCRQSVRVPRGRGKINIRCPKCNTHFIKKT